MPPDTELLDKTFRALADPSRREIVVRLSRGPASVSDLAAPLEMALPVIPLPMASGSFFASDRL